jgi:glucosylceramidase
VPWMRQITTTVFLLLLLAASARASTAATVAQRWLTSADAKSLLLRQQDVPFASSIVSDAAAATVGVDDSTLYQQIDGFGAALSDSSAWLFSQMPAAQRTAALTALFSPISGIGLSMVRVPASTCDFALSDYTFDDVKGDTALQYLSVAHDLNYTIPILRLILSINPNVKVILSPWTAPACELLAHALMF